MAPYTYMVHNDVDSVDETPRQEEPRPGPSGVNSSKSRDWSSCSSSDDETSSCPNKVISQSKAAKLAQILGKALYQSDGAGCQSGTPTSPNGSTDGNRRNSNSKVTFKKQYKNRLKKHYRDRDRDVE